MSRDTGHTLNAGKTRAPRLLDFSQFCYNFLTTLLKSRFSQTCATFGDLVKYL